MKSLNWNFVLSTEMQFSLTSLALFTMTYNVLTTCPSLWLGDTFALTSNWYFPMRYPDCSDTFLDCLAAMVKLSSLALTAPLESRLISTALAQLFSMRMSLVPNPIPAPEKLPSALGPWLVPS